MAMGNSLATGVIDLHNLLIARPTERAISEKRFLVLKHPVHHDTLDRSIAPSVDREEGCKLALARECFELAALALGHKIALDAIAHPHHRRAAPRPGGGHACLEHDAIG